MDGVFHKLFGVLVKLIVILYIFYRLLKLSWNIKIYA